MDVDACELRCFAWFCDAFGFGSAMLAWFCVLDFCLILRLAIIVLVSDFVLLLLLTSRAVKWHAHFAFPNLESFLVLAQYK
jgi:hypothetical protein